MTNRKIEMLQRTEMELTKALHKMLGLANDFEHPMSEKQKEAVQEARTALSKASNRGEFNG